VTTKGKKQIVLNFPPDSSLGEILLDNEVRSQDTISIICRGKQTIEGGHRLYFFPSLDCIYHPQLFSKFGPGVLHSITLPTVEPKSKESIKPALIEISKLKGLKRFDAVECASMSDALVNLLDQFPDLTDLSLNANSVSVKQLIQTRIINKLTSLKYTYKGSKIDQAIADHVLREAMHPGHHGRHHEDGEHREHHGDEIELDETPEQSITPLLHCLTRSPDLEVLEMPNVPLYSQDLQIIGQLKKLKAVDLSDSNILSNSVEALSDLPNLQVFHVDHCLIDASAIPYFKKLAALSLKIIYMQSDAMTPEVQEQYRKQLPGVMVN
jgi:hypothetical protein